MSEYVSVMDGGETSEIGALHFLMDLFRAGYMTGWAASQRGAGANMSVDVAVGAGIIYRSSDTYPFGAYSDAIKNVAVSAADGSNPRLDILVAWIDTSVRSAAASNNPGALKFSIIAGTPAGSPTAPSDGTIQSAIGASNPFIKLARIAVGTGVTSIVNANITDLRVPAAMKMPYLYGGGSNTVGHLVPNAADDTVALLNAAQAFANKTFAAESITAANLAPGALLLGYAQVTANQSSITTEVDLTGLSVTVTVPSGTRKVKITANAPLSNSGATGRSTIYIKEGATPLQNVSRPNENTSAIYNGFLGQVILTPTAGVHTYKLSAECTAGTSEMGASSQAPAFILVELV